MKTQVVLLLVALAGALAAPLLRVKEPIPNSYIVVFHKNATNQAVIRHMSSLSSLLTQEEGKIVASYNINDEFKGFAARLSPRALQTQLEADIVDFVEQDQIMRMSAPVCKLESGAPWGIARVSGSAPGNTDFKYNKDGTGVTAYVIDTGILTTHNEFTGRISWGANFVGDDKDYDCQGHGTHVAGTVAGTKYGIAKKAHLVAVKVLGCDGSGTNAGVINGINWVASNAKKPSVANMSLGGSKSTATNNAVTAAVNSGITFVVAAGNSGADACGFSPASASSAISVGATEQDNLEATQEDGIASFSNYGKCVTILAPGVSIVSAWIGGNTKTSSISGTSMASPHVAGAAAQYLSQNPDASPAQVKKALLDGALPGVVDFSKCPNSSCKRTSPNLFLQSPCVE